MSIPVRCYSCGNVIGTLKIYLAAQKAETKQDFQQIFKDYNIQKHRYCCKTTIMTFVPVIEKLICDKHTNHGPNYP